MSRSYREGDPRRRATKTTGGDVFRCRHCRMIVGDPPSGGRQRNHCPFCLYSRHVDGKTPGDRASRCGASMEPIGTFRRAGGEEVVLHRCLGCGFERYCRIAADDDDALLTALPVVEPESLAAAHAADPELA